MNIEELNKFRLTDVINFHDELNPQLFLGERMRDDIRERLLTIVEHFQEFLGVENLALVDITLSGSNAAYTYTPHSDIDLHLVVDFTRLPDDDVYRELFDAKKFQYNEQHDIKVKGYDVELYVQDAAQKHVTLGEYSILNDGWNRIPTKQRANLDQDSTKEKYLKLRDLAIKALASDNQAFLNTVLDIVKRYRRAGLAEKGEFGPENLAFKLLRKEGLFDKLWAKKRSLIDLDLSLESPDNPVDTDLERELAMEFEGRTKTEDMIKEMFKARPSLFDDLDYDAIFLCAENVCEASYEGNIGAMEVMKFYQTAPREQVDLLARLIKAGKTKEAWQLIQKVTGTQLVGKEFQLEGVGLIRKGSNVTPDVGEAQTRIEAEKLGFKTTDDGVPPTLQTNGQK